MVTSKESEAQVAFGSPIHPIGFQAVELIEGVAQQFLS